MSSSSSRHKKLDASSALTPQRKHRKLLKDGSGTEVWPESIESIFVKGLHEYWESPWATYAQSRGRSRWRNQFLVDYLQKAGINRSKKQVASHIQVLRNMWKGEPGPSRRLVIVIQSNGLFDQNFISCLVGKNLSWTAPSNSRIVL
ncbi:hypothetical protein DXG03_000861 [Asterophora parasitica]|uniref:TEA domain-containing protein n=1 Tax=Asterophora parasitica TaxID=117018 RepID=A0A9P7G7C3_9AGAR|nr:hypothetical protein DXG03_000861 [Asterophora parasitica]